jgi:hypothetical protein
LVKLYYSFNKADILKVIRSQVKEKKGRQTKQEKEKKRSK